MIINIPKVFKCVMPVGLSEITGNLGNNMKYGIYQIASKMFLSVYKMSNHKFIKGYLFEIDLTDDTQCSLPNISKESKKTDADLSIVHDNCKDITIYKIANLTTNPNNTILDHNITTFQNGTASIFGQTYEANDNMFSLNNITHFLGLDKCTPETAISALQQYKDYLLSLTTTTTESPLNILKNVLDDYGISLENASHIEIGKSILNALNIPFTDPTTTENPNDDTNDGDYTATYIAAACIVTGVVGALLGYGIKYGIDWYKGGNNTNDDENQLLNITNNIDQTKEFISRLIKELKELSNKEEKYEELEEDKNELNYATLITLLSKFNKTLNNDQWILQVLNNLKKLMDNHHELDSHVCQNTLHTLQETLSDSSSNSEHYTSHILNEQPPLMGDTDCE